VMCRPVLTKDAYARLADELGAAHRLPSKLRDLDALPPVVRKLDVGLASRAAAGAVDELLRARRKRIDPGLVEAILVDGAALIDPIPDQLVEEFPVKVRRADVVDGVRATYRRAQASMRRAIATGEERHVHDWRKRTKELNYQLELLTARRGRKARKLQKAFAEMAEELGAITDLLNLRAYILNEESLRTRRGMAGFLARIDARAKVRTRRAFEAGAELFGEPPRKLAHRLADALH